MASRQEWVKARGRQLASSGSLPTAEFRTGVSHMVELEGKFGEKSYMFLEEKEGVLRLGAPHEEVCSGQGHPTMGCAQVRDTPQ